MSVDNAKMMTAIHEAGHVVKLYHSGFRADGMGLVCEKGHWNGCTVRNFSKIPLLDKFVDDFYNPPIGNSAAMDTLYQKLDCYLQNGNLVIQNFIRDFVMFVAAGEEAERFFVNRYPAKIRDDNVGPDGATQLFFCTISNGLSQYVVIHLRCLLSCYKTVIEDLAKALYDKGHLIRPEIENILKYKCCISQVESFIDDLKQKSLTELKSMLPTYEIRKKMSEWVLNTTGRGYLIWLDSLLEYKSIKNEISQRI
jgi:hypothetical protein